MILSLSLWIHDPDRRHLRRSTILHPSSQLGKETGQRPARAAPAVSQPGDLEVSIKIVDIGEKVSHGIVVVISTLGGDYSIGLAVEILSIFPRRLALRIEETRGQNQGTYKSMEANELTACVSELG
jgi:hypothetical protein